MHFVCFGNVVGKLLTVEWSLVDFTYIMYIATHLALFLIPRILLSLNDR